jgi:uncharacterized lipoprotein YajG
MRTTGSLLALVALLLAAGCSSSPKPAEAPTPVAAAEPEPIAEPVAAPLPSAEDIMEAALEASGGRAAL